MLDEGDEESFEALAEHRLSREGMEVTLDRGFEDGTYCVYVDFNDLKSRVGFAAAHRRAADYCKLLKSQLERLAGHRLGKIEDASRQAEPGRRRDLELTYLTFPLVMMDGRFHDAAMQEQFRLAVLRTNQQWDQAQARWATQKQDSRRDAFRQQLEELLGRDAYRHLDGATRERLLEDVSQLAFPPRGMEL